MANWNGHDFVDRWSGTNVTPLLVSAPSEGDLARSIGGSRTTGKNMPVWREKKGSSAFLLRFGPLGATEVWSCRLKKRGTLAKLNKIESMRRSVTWRSCRKRLHLGWQRLTVQAAGRATVSYEMPMRRQFMPRRHWRQIWVRQTRVIALDSAGTLFSYSKDGTMAASC